MQDSLPVSIPRGFQVKKALNLDGSRLQLSAARFRLNCSGHRDMNMDMDAQDTLERALAKLEKADAAFCFTSGEAAVSAVANLVGNGTLVLDKEIVAGEDIYGGSQRLLSHVTKTSGIQVKRVNTSNLDEVAAAIDHKTKLVWLESPTNPRLRIADIPRISAIAHAHRALVLVDNSIMSPVMSRPLELGADIVMYSDTNFITGNGDVMAGVLAVKQDRLVQVVSVTDRTFGGLGVITSAPHGATQTHQELQHATSTHGAPQGAPYGHQPARTQEAARRPSVQSWACTMSSILARHLVFKKLPQPIWQGNHQVNFDLFDFFPCLL
ncbi:hypothetical protein GQ457_09G028430 [Hibiscus cannabinus]